MLRLQYQPGDFAHVGRTLVEAWPPERCDDEAIDAIRDAFGIGSRRSALQDLRFLIDELVEIAARALSPGVNDPFTAVTCLDWLGAALSDLAGRELPSHLRVDEDGALRVIAHPETFGELRGSLVRRAGAILRDRHGRGAALHPRAGRGRRSAATIRTGSALLASYADKLEALSREALSGFNLDRVTERADELRRALAEPDYKRRLRDSTAWLGGYRMTRRNRR